MHKARTQHVWSLLVLIGLVVLAVGSTDCGSSSMSEPGVPKPSTPPVPGIAQSTPSKSSVAMPEYEVVNRDTSDTPIKTQIELHAVVSGSITEAGLRQLLHGLYDEARSTGGFKYNGGQPTHVFIYLYTSREHFKSGLGQRIAMLHKVGDDSPIHVNVRTEIISQLDAKPEFKYGLSEQQRTEAFKALVMAEDRATEEAERLYPLPFPLKPGFSQARVTAQLHKQLEAAESLKKRYKAEVASKYDVTEEQLGEISIEGITKNWPMP